MVALFQPTRSVIEVDSLTESALATALATANDGDIIVFAEGLSGSLTLTESLVIENDITLIGTGITLTGDSDFDLIKVENAEVTLQGLALEGGDDGVDVEGNRSGLTLRHVSITGTADDGIDLDDVNWGHLNLTNVVIAGAGDEGIEVSDSHRVTLNLAYTTIVGSGDDGIDINSSDRAHLSVNHSLVLGSDDDHLDVDDSEQVTVNVDNSILGWAEDEGIEVHNSTQTHLALGHTIVFASGDDAIDIEDSAYSTLTVGAGWLLNSDDNHLDVDNSLGTQVIFRDSSLAGAGNEGIEIQASHQTSVALLEGTVLTAAGDNGIDVEQSNWATVVVANSTINSAGSRVNINESLATTLVWVELLELDSLTGRTRTAPIVGTVETDMVVGTSADDIVPRGTKADMFALTPNGGSDTITNFVTGRDQRAVSALGITAAGFTGVIGRDNSTVSLEVPGGSRSPLAGVEATSLTADPCLCAETLH